MSRILLDTSAYSAFRRGHPGIVTEVQKAQLIALTPIVLGELLAGFDRGAKRAENRSDLLTFLSAARVQVTDVTAETSERYAVILQDLAKAGNPIPTNDIWIAASAMQHGLRVVTTDAHFKKVPHVVTAYFDARGG